MPRNIEYKIRIRDGLRRRLETAAKKSDVSINQEMASRLEKSFEHGDMLKLGEITADLEDVYGRFAREQRDQSADTRIDECRRGSNQTIAARGAGSAQAHHRVGARSDSGHHPRTWPHLR